MPLYRQRCDKVVATYLKIVIETYTTQYKYNQLDFLAFSRTGSRHIRRNSGRLITDTDHTADSRWRSETRSTSG